MGKVLGSILTIAAAVAVNFIPGVGQFLSAAIVNAGLSAGLSVGVGAAIASGLVTAVSLAGLASFAGLIGLGPSAPKPETTEQSIKISRPPRVSGYGTSRLYGAYIFYDTAEDGTAVDVFAVHDGKIDSIVQRYLGDDPVTLSGTVVQAGTDKRYKDSAVNFYSTNGASPGTAISALTSLLSGIWTSAHRGDGVVIVATTWNSVKAKDFQETYPAGGPQPASIAAKWQLCYDWRKDSTKGGTGSHRYNTPSTWEWSENPVLHLCHYLMVRQGYDFLTQIYPAISYWTDAADDCDTTVSLKGGGTEKRYRGCVAHKHTDDHKGVVGNITACFDGWLSSRSDGAMVVYSGRYYAPTVSIGADEIVSYTYEDGIEDEAAVNEIVVSYISADNDYNQVEADPWRDETDITSRGRVNSTGFDPQVPSHGQARRLAKRLMIRTMAQYRGTVTTNALGRSARGERYINLTIEEAGATFYDGPAEITQLKTLSNGGVQFAWVAISSAIDSWTPSTEEGDPAPAGDRVAQAGLTAPTIDSISVDFGKNSQGRLIIDITAPDRNDLTWWVHWKASTDTDYGPANKYKDKASGASVELKTDLILLDESLDVQVKYSYGDGRESDWSDAYTLDSTTDYAQPDHPKSVDASKSGSDVTVDWKAPSAYVTEVRVFRNTSNNFGTATDISGAIPSSPSLNQTYLDAGLAADSYWWWVVAYSAGGVASTPGGPASKTVP
ncbi:MAG: hypothetical protein GC201_00960 [Alphaproteobacteria bacterium]|nr:hypothetical protein [Alphaproteobacteria bacterium]